MAKVSKSMDRAIKTYRAKNPDQTGYTALRRGAFNFANGLSKPQTKSYAYLKSDYAREIVEGEERRITDFKDLTRYSVRSLKELGVSDSEIKKLL